MPIKSFESQLNKIKPYEKKRFYQEHRYFIISAGN